MKDYMREFGSILSVSRMRLDKISIHTMSKLIGVSYGVIGGWEQGKTLPSEDKLEIIATSYGIDIQDLREKFSLAKQQRGMSTHTLKSLTKEPTRQKTTSQTFGSAEIDRSRTRPHPRAL
jgi:transcriptional regulator with XRE-family HTH domain